MRLYGHGLAFCTKKSVMLETETKSLRSQPAKDTHTDKRKPRGVLREHISILLDFTTRHDEERYFHFPHNGAAFDGAQWPLVR